MNVLRGSAFLSGHECSIVIKNLRQLWCQKHVRNCHDELLPESDHNSPCNLMPIYDASCIDRGRKRLQLMMHCGKEATAIHHAVRRPQVAMDCNRKTPTIHNAIPRRFMMHPTIGVVAKRLQLMMTCGRKTTTIHHAIPRRLKMHPTVGVVAKRPKSR